jgi:hypothetical protein
VRRLVATITRPTLHNDHQCNRDEMILAGEIRKKADNSICVRTRHSFSIPVLPYFGSEPENARHVSGRRKMRSVASVL